MNPDSSVTNWLQSWHTASVMFYTYFIFALCRWRVITEMHPLVPVQLTSILLDILLMTNGCFGFSSLSAHLQITSSSLSAHFIVEKRMSRERHSFLSSLCSLLGVPFAKWARNKLGAGTNGCASEYLTPSKGPKFVSHLSKAEPIGPLSAHLNKPHTKT